MAAALAVRVSDEVDDILAKQTAVHVQVTGADVNDSTTYDDTHTPTEDPIPYYIEATSPSGTQDLRSVKFTPSSDGKWEWDGLIFPEDGSWTLTLTDARDDSSVTTASVTVA